MVADRVESAERVSLALQLVANDSSELLLRGVVVSNERARSLANLFGLTFGSDELDHVYIAGDPVELILSLDDEVVIFERPAIAFATISAMPLQPELFVTIYIFMAQHNLHATESAS